MAMRRRDEAIAVSSEAFAEKKALLRTRQSELDSQARFLEAEKANNKELEGRISAFEREVVGVWVIAQWDWYIETLT